MEIQGKIMEIKEYEPETVNSNEIISDYHFCLQLLWEEKMLDFENGLAS